MSSQDSRCDFMSLPPEVRLRIYEDLLVCKSHITPVFHHLLGFNIQGFSPTLLNSIQQTMEYRPRARQPITLSVLRTCKQIHTEGSPIFYSKNEIVVDEPEPIIRWFALIGRMNVRHLRRIRIFVGAVQCFENTCPQHSACVGQSWYKLLDELARNAAGLRHIYIYWSFKCSGAAGKDLHFVRRLGELQRLQSMDLDGYYAKQWPIYLTRKLGIEVHEEAPSLPTLKKRYQRGTETLLP